MSTSKPAGGAPGADPSMEDILASIRRILSEDEPPPPPPPPAIEAPSAAPVHAALPMEELPGSDVIALDSSMMVEEPEPIAVVMQPILPTPEPARPQLPPPRLEPERSAAERMAPERMAQERTAQERTDQGRTTQDWRAESDSGLVGESASSAAASSVGSLLRTLARERQNVAVYRNGPTIEDLVREEIRPLLKEWLDSNLPPLVERLVRAEIERVVGRALP